MTSFPLPYKLQPTIEPGSGDEKSIITLECRQWCSSWKNGTILSGIFNYFSRDVAVSAFALYSSGFGFENHAISSWVCYPKFPYHLDKSARWNLKIGHGRFYFLSELMIRYVSDKKRCVSFGHCSTTLSMRFA